jgi:hypothetical protein
MVVQTSVGPYEFRGEPPVGDVDGFFRLFQRFCDSLDDIN